MLEATSPPSARVAAAKIILDMSLRAQDAESFEVWPRALEEQREGWAAWQVRNQQFWDELGRERDCALQWCTADVLCV